MDVHGFPAGGGGSGGIFHAGEDGVKSEKISVFSVISKMIRRVAGNPPWGGRTRPPPRGGWRGYGRDVAAWQKTSGRGRDGGSTAECRRDKRNSTPPASKAIPLRRDHAEASIDGHPQYSPRRPFHPLRSHNPEAVLLRAEPPSRRGAGACARFSLPIPSARVPFESHPHPFFPLPPWAGGVLQSNHRKTKQGTTSDLIQS